MSYQKLTEGRRYQILTLLELGISTSEIVDWSPEQITSVLTKAGASVSHEWIYRYVALDKRQGGKLYRHLRQGHKRYRKGLKEKAPN